MRLDLDLLQGMLGFIRANDTGSVLRQFGIDPSVAAHCRFDHGAVLVFPSTVAELCAELREHGLAPGEAVPSVVVRDRLCRRYGYTDIEVAILRAPVTAAGDSPCEIEIFALPSAPREIELAERAEQHETHVALQVVTPDPIVLSGLTTALDRAGLTPDGGGYNAHVDSTVLYFRKAAQRLELISQGYHAEALTTHLRQQPAYRLLSMMTGAWETQAIAVAAELRIADYLAQGMSTQDIAVGTGTCHDSLLRLMRYLASLGVLRGPEFELTELGELLRTDARYSLHALALLYGGSFYQSFGELSHAVRTGRESFAHVFGKHHFDYFAERPELGFNKAMASSASIFGQVAEVFDFSSAKVVVDVAGGNGELLNHILDVRPHVHGVLFERPDVIGSLRRRERCELVAGDFTTGVPQGGDVYLLSRVLHDWDDQQCRQILRQLAGSMPEDAELLIIERLLPEDSSPSLAFAWDVHMLCNVGGRERTMEHYREMLAEAGFTLAASHELPLDFALLQARIAAPHHQ
ncbi:hypothetical protein JOF56_003451 [Kibdelosporangium banguiense]|uniref:O-methyltransferase n=1 Tax=Kibdelosporangium banguiense TaxID=1365924 RepID=A0ABS4TGU9_9PSEU|nr:acetylserotonin O-methyltransferase [Kibdelosporangium banguiense]MBP2323066.1 hypothetical protein [Kibdelosporangium banguiense]